MAQGYYNNSSNDAVTLEQQARINQDTYLENKIDTKVNFINDYYNQVQNYVNQISALSTKIDAYQFPEDASVAGTQTAALCTGYDGHRYNTAFDAVTSQFSDIHAALEKSFSMSHFDLFSINESKTVNGVTVTINNNSVYVNGTATAATGIFFDYLKTENQLFLKKLSGKKLKLETSAYTGNFIVQFTYRQSESDDWHEITAIRLGNMGISSSLLSSKTPSSCN